MKPEKTPNSVSLKLSTYLRTVNSAWYWTTLLMTCVTLITVFTVPDNFYPFTYARAVIVALSVSWLPGYSLTRALFPVLPPVKKSTNLGSVERVALSIGTSLCIITVTGLLLNYTPWGIHLIPMLLSLLSLTIFFSTVALLREYKANRDSEASNTV